MATSLMLFRQENITSNIWYKLRLVQANEVGENGDLSDLQKGHIMGEPI